MRWLLWIEHAGGANGSVRTDPSLVLIDGYPVKVRAIEIKCEPGAILRSKIVKDGEDGPAIP